LEDHRAALGDACLAAADGTAAREHWKAAEAILADLGHPDLDGLRAKLAAAGSPS
jgi:CheY-like chemotaxis protein